MRGGKQTLVCSRTVHSSTVSGQLKNNLKMKLETFIILIFTTISTFGYGQTKEIEINGTLFSFKQVELDTLESVENKIVELYRNEKKLLTHTVFKEEGDCSSIHIQLGNYKVEGNKIIFYSYWAATDRMPGSILPFGYREQIYSIDSLGILKLTEAKIYIENYVTSENKKFLEENGWKHKGLKESQHIGMIAIHPTNSDIIYVAAYGPLWNKGGERGLYKTIDGGDNWTKVLDISEYTGISEVHISPDNPHIVYAIAHQRMRHVYTYLGGGPESAIYHSTNDGKSFDKLEGGLPKGIDIGRIGMDISPVNSDVLYAIIEAQDKKGGVFKSTDRGASWSKMNDFSTSGNYYQEIICDPVDVNKIYFMDTYGRFSKDAGKTIERMTIKNKHVDDHCIWINPSNTNHWIMGCDGGLYETWDHSATWDFKANLPITQFYKVAVDNTLPFYYIYGGTQDNFSLGGPSQTTSQQGIRNSDWFVTNGGDGFESQIDPDDPNIVYAQAQYGYLVRYNKSTGQSIFIQPQPGENEAAYRWNWDAPLLISPHSSKRLYFAANKLFKSDDQGNSWQTISGDLTQQIDRNQLEIMDKKWPIDAVMKNKSTTIYGNIVALDESPLAEGVLYIGTDDGLIQVSENGGKSWSKSSKFGKVPSNTYVNLIKASRHSKDEVFAVFNNHKRGDFTPYLYRSQDRGKSWKNVAGNLPESGACYAFEQDSKNPNLWFAGTEFGLFFSIDQGENWQQLKNGLPTIAIRDMAIHEGESDLILGTFGRGFYVMDDYSPLRELQKMDGQKETIFPISPAMMYAQSSELGRGEKGFQGDALYTAANPKPGARIRFFAPSDLTNLKELRKKDQKNEDHQYPSLEDMSAERMELPSYYVLTILDKDGNFVRNLKGSSKKGMQELVWDFKYSSQRGLSGEKENPGRWALPGEYKVELRKVEAGKLSNVLTTSNFSCTYLNANQMDASSLAELKSFSEKISHLSRSLAACNGEYQSLSKNFNAITNVFKYILPSDEKQKQVLTLQKQLDEVRIILYGDALKTKYEFEALTSLNRKVNMIIWNLYSTIAAPTETFMKDYELAYGDAKKVIQELEKIDASLKDLDTYLDQIDAPYTPGRKPKLD